MTDNAAQLNNRLMGRLSSLARTGRLSHAYVFEGDLETGLNLAKYFAEQILLADSNNPAEATSISARVEAMSHEDLFYVEKEAESGSGKKSVKIKQIRALTAGLQSKAFGSRNIAIVNDADTMSTEAQNSFLKTLEEPTPGTVIILLSENTENLLPTIMSRCTLIRISHENGISLEMQESAEKLIKLLSEGASFLVLRETAEKAAANRDEALQLLDGMVVTFGDMATGRSPEAGLYRKDDIYRAVRLIEEARRDIMHDVSYKNVIRKLLLIIGG